jgi:hypothetical protein
VDAAPAITSETGALQLLESALGYLAAADPAQMPAVIQARALTVLERADARATAARAQIVLLADAFTGGAGRWSATPTGPPPRGTGTGPKCCAATARPPAPGNPPGPLTGFRD